MLINHSRGEDVAFTAICRQNNWKRTAQRRAVYNCLCGNREHPTVETVWQAAKEMVPDVSLDSIYRILDDFEGAGLIRRLEGAKLIRYDADTEPHEHFICSECGRMMDFAFLETDYVIEQCRDFGRVDSVDLTVHGVCHSCLEAKTPPVERQ